MIEIPSRREALVNAFLVLYVIVEASRRGLIHGRTKLMKLLYEAERELTRKNLRALSLTFIKWKYGPWSPEAQIDLKCLVDNLLVVEDQTTREIHPTPKGLEVLKSARELLDKNRVLIEVVNRVLQVHALDTGTVMKRRAYDTPVLEKGELVEELKKGEVLLMPVNVEKASRFFLIDDPWLETIDLMIEKESRDALEEILRRPKLPLSEYRPIEELEKEYGIR